MKMYVVAYEMSSKPENFYYTMRCLWIMFVRAVCFLFLIIIIYSKTILVISSSSSSLSSPMNFIEVKRIFRLYLTRRRSRRHSHILAHAQMFGRGVGLVPIHPRVSILDPVFLRPDPKWRSKQRRTIVILACACAKDVPMEFILV